MTPLLLALALLNTPALLNAPAPLNAPALSPSPVLIAEPSRQVEDRLGGGSQVYRIDSAILGQTRRIDIHLPPSFTKTGPARRYPVIVVFDGEYVSRAVVTMSEALARFGQMPEVVVVGIENRGDSDDRVHDLTPPGMSVSGSSTHEGGDQFLDFIDKELLPAVDTQFRTAPPRVLAGLSSGGVLATYAAATRDTFRLILSMDAPVHLEDGWLAKRLVERAKSNPAPLRYVSYEARFGWPENRWNALTAVASRSWRLRREHIDHETHNSMQFLAAYLGLRELFSDYSMMAAPEVPTTSIVPYYDKLGEAYGAPVIPPAQLLRQVTEDLLIEGRGAAARTTFDTLVASYGAPADAEEWRKRIAEVERLPPPTETLEGLLATPFPAVEQARRWIGDWEGEQWVNDLPNHHKAALHLFVEGDHVTGTFVSWPEPDFELKQKLEYLKVTPDGLTFGFMNGMRPRGMLMHEGHFDGEALSGVVRFGGVKVVMPGGEKPPTHHFVLRRMEP
jgi:putative esterase